MTTKDRQRGCLLGLAIGDALGAAVEFQMPGTFELVISPNGADYDFTWASLDGKLYDLVSSTDLSPTASSGAATTDAAMDFAEQTIRTMSTLSMTGEHLADTAENRVSP